MNDARYPIGRYIPVDPLSHDDRRRAIDQIALCPDELRRALGGLSTAQLETPYRDGGWTVRQVAHHLPDSHMNAYVRHKLAVTEDSPTIRPYQEARWAELTDGREGDVEISLKLLEALHDRWVRFLSGLEAEQFERTFLHPATGKSWTLSQSVAMYAWHGRHHVAHIDTLRERMGW